MSVNTVADRLTGHWQFNRIHSSADFAPPTVDPDRAAQPAPAPIPALEGAT